MPLHTNNAARLSRQLQKDRVTTVVGSVIMYSSDIQKYSIFLEIIVSKPERLHWVTWELSYTQLVRQL
jgi:hypothetical protein